MTFLAACDEDIYTKEREEEMTAKNQGRKKEQRTCSTENRKNKGTERNK
jgi:hypothetical protein